MGMTTAYVHTVLAAMDDGAYVGLLTAAPSDAGGGTEVAASGYARQAITFSTPSSRATSNNADLTFGPAGANWGTITHIAIYDASSSGTMRWWQALSVSKAVTTGESFLLPSGDLDVAASAS
jgi:hypothetical protein